MTTRVGTTFSHYRILEELGAGGMGVVYVAQDLRLDRTVAIKFLSDELGNDPAAKARFLHEARAISRLDHPNICSVHEIDETEDGRIYIVMAHYEGAMLDRRMESGPLSIGEALGIATQVAQGLAKAHAAGVVHRDIKPNNIMFTNDGVIKILDFGLAKVTDASSITTTGELLGTPTYMSPEQFRSESAGPAADIWSTGVLLYVLLTGRVPFKGDSPMATMYAVLNRDPEPLTTVAPHVPSELEAIVRRCLDKNPERRYTDAGQLAAALRDLLRQVYVDRERSDFQAIPSVARTALVTPRTSHWFGPRRRVAVLVGVPLVVLGVWFAGSRLMADRSEPLRVAVPVPEITMVTDSSDVHLTSAAIQSALLRGLAGFRGLAVIDPSEIKNVAGGPSTIAAVVSADEVVTVSVGATKDEWHVLLRWTTRRNTVRWTDEFAVPRDNPLYLANALIARLPRAYPRLERRGHARSIQIPLEDYTAFLNAYRFTVLYPVPVQLEEKLGVLDALHRRAPTFLDAYLLDASFSRYAYQVSRDRAHLERASRMAEQARTLAPDDPRALAGLIHVSLLGDDLDGAARWLGAFEELDPGNADIEWYRALLTEKNGQVDEALRILTRVTERRPSITYVRSLTDMEYRNGRVDLARAHLDGLIRRFPEDLFAHSKLAQLELLYGSAERADSIYTVVLGRTPMSPFALNNRGLARMLLRRYPAALADFRSAFARTPKNGGFLLNVADCEGLTGQVDSAKVHYSRVLELSHSDFSASSLMRQAQCLAHLGRKQEAVSMAMEGLRLAPEDSEGFYKASLVYTLVGDRESALANAKRAIDKGVDPRWFSLVWFDALRNDSGFIQILRTKPRA